MDISTLIAQIQENKEKIEKFPPARYDDPYSHKWDSELKEIFKGKWVRNSTDFNYGKGFVFGIILESSVPFVDQLVDDLKRTFWTIELRLSVILPYYVAYIYRISSENNQIIEKTIIENPTPEMRKYLTLAEQFAEERSFRRLPQEFLYEIVPDIELALADPGKATVFNCLFEDFSTYYP